VHLRNTWRRKRPQHNDEESKRRRAKPTHSCMTRELTLQTGFAPRALSIANRNREPPRLVSIVLFVLCHGTWYMVGHDVKIGIRSYCTRAAFHLVSLLPSFRIPLLIVTCCHRVFPCSTTQYELYACCTTGSMGGGLGCGSRRRTGVAGRTALTV